MGVGRLEVGIGVGKLEVGGLRRELEVEGGRLEAGDLEMGCGSWRWKVGSGRLRLKCKQQESTNHLWSGSGVMTGGTADPLARIIF